MTSMESRREAGRVAVGGSERVPIASDHAGCELRMSLVRLLRELGYEPDDLGPSDASPVDYPDYAHPLAGMVASGEVRRGVLLCGTGLGMSYAANRHAGVRAAVAWTPEVARLSRQHNDANVLVLPARFLTEEEGRAILRSWLETPFEGGRHSRRVAKIELDAGAAGGGPMTALLTGDGSEEDGDGRGCGTHEPGSGET